VRNAGHALSEPGISAENLQCGRWIGLLQNDTFLYWIAVLVFNGARGLRFGGKGFRKAFNAKGFRRAVFVSGAVQVLAQVTMARR